MAEEFIERRIITGLIVSNEFIESVKPIWAPEYISSATARLIAGWCFEYWEQYKKAPRRDIEGIYTQKLKTGLSSEQAEDIEDILSGLSDDFERTQFNVPYLLDQTRSYFQEQSLKLYTDRIRNAIDAGDITEAEKLAVGYSSPVVDQEAEERTIDPFSSPVKIRRAFEQQSHPIIKFPKALGKFWNSQMVRDGFVALLGPEKRGKTYWLLEIAMKAMASGCNVAFFQAGDMTEAQQLRRICVYLAKRSDRPRYCMGRYIPTVDCYKNQTDTCEREERESPFGVFTPGRDPNTITYEQLVEAVKENREYSPCYNCEEMEGAVWLKWAPEVKPLTWKEAYAKAKEWKKRYSKRFKLTTYPNETLTCREIANLLDLWERREGFVADVILIDYADIMAPDPDIVRLDGREQINKTWQRLRRMSQERHCLVVTATQSATTSYDKESIQLKDFSNDKRKYAHVTACYALNQTAEEKTKGVMRIGELVVRDDEFDTSRQVKVLQCLQRGRPVIGSFF